MGTIVVVEGPDPAECFLANALKLTGRDVVGATSARDALASLTDTPSAALVRLVGRSAQVARTCHQLRDDLRFEGVPLVVCGEGVDHAEQAFAAGADDFVQTPADAHELLMRVEWAEAPPLRPLLRPQTVLVVDDDAFFRRSIADLLTREGYRTIEAGSGTEALGLLERRVPSLVIVDLFMPGLGGVELVQRLRAEPQWQRLPVIAISGIRAAHEAGLAAALSDLRVHDFVEKRGPALETLAAIVDELLREDAELARPRRTSARFMGEFRRVPEEPWVSAFVCNLGIGGAFLRTLVHPPPDSMVYFRLYWGDERPRLVARARVVWVRPRSMAGSVTGIGIEFGEIGDVDRENLRLALYS